MSDYLTSLNPEQGKAVTTTEGPILVIAGPGSGKTRVLTYRIAHLIKSGVSPWEILALTFTNKAAREMKERIASVVGRDANNVWAGTFHSIFARILRIEGINLGYPSNFTIYDTEDTKNVIASVIKDMNLDKNSYNPNAVRSRISSAKSKVMSPKDYAGNMKWIEKDRRAKMPYIYEIYKRYTAKCRKAGAMDFDDLLYQLYTLFDRFPDIKEKYQHKFRYLLVDEFQDTNHLQYAILKQFVKYPESPENICVVGDDAQSIYAFRGATIENILNFEQDFKALEVFKLEQNYRSTEFIVNAANEIITNNKKQIQKKIWTDCGAGAKIKVIKALSDIEEGRLVADLILEHKNRNHLSNKDISILYRTNAQSRIFEENLRRLNITYKVFGGLSFYQRKEVKDLIAYMRVAVNPKDEEALKRVINYPKRGIGNTSVQKILDQANTTGLTMWECLASAPVGGKAKQSLVRFIGMITSFQEKLETVDAYDLATFIARQSGVYDLLKSDNSPEGVGRLENLNALLDGVKEFVDNDELFLDASDTPDKSLASYLQNIALLTDLDSDTSDEDYVTLMSVHSAKGLEFPSVFVVGLEEQLFPSYLSLNSRDELDEERRLFYVAVTRAKQLLTLSFATSRYKFGQIRYNEPSRFVEEIPEQYLDGLHTVRPSAKESYRSRIVGNFQPIVKRSAFVPKVDPSSFHPSPGNSIQVGMKVLHLKFGEGKVISIDGASDNKVATIFFNGISNPERRIMLKFAKLEIVN